MGRRLLAKGMTAAMLISQGEFSKEVLQGPKCSLQSIPEIVKKITERFDNYARFGLVINYFFRIFPVLNHVEFYVTFHHFHHDIYLPSSFRTKTPALVSTNLDMPDSILPSVSSSASSLLHPGLASRRHLMDDDRKQQQRLVDSNISSFDHGAATHPIPFIPSQTRLVP